MIQRINISGLRINLVFRHRFEKDRDLLERMRSSSYELGMWFKTYKAVAKPKKGPAVIGKDGKMSTGFMLGFNFIICKFWIDICYRPLTLKID